MFKKKKEAAPTFETASLIVIELRNVYSTIILLVTVSLPA
jgi:hypothetical protein